MLTFNGFLNDTVAKVRGRRLFGMWLEQTRTLVCGDDGGLDLLSALDEALPHPIVHLPADLCEVWSAKKAIIVRDDGATIDFYGRDWVGPPQNLDREQLALITDIFLVSLLTDKVISINVRGCEKLTDTSIQCIAEHCPLLTELNVWGCKLLTDKSIEAIATRCPKLRKLYVWDCYKLTNMSIRAVATNCAALTKLNFWGCSNITDESITAIAEGCPSLKELNIRYCNKLTDVSIKEIAERCPLLKRLDADCCAFTSLPPDIGLQLPELEWLDLSDNRLTTLPRSIVKLKESLLLNVDRNPLERPPLEIARQGFEAMERYFDELEKGSKVSKVLKVVLVGDGHAGKTSLRNALAGRAYPYQEPRTIHLDIEKITINAKLDINVYDCGGQEEYFASQLPYLTGMAVYIVVVEAQFATDEYLEDKLHRFLVVLQNRVPGAIVLPIVSKIDMVNDGERRCRWLERKIEEWQEKTKEAVVRRNESATRFKPFCVISGALAISITDSRIVTRVRENVQPVRNKLVELALRKPPLFGIGGEIPSTFMKVRQLLGAVVEKGDDEEALQALCNGTAQGLSESVVVSPNGAYRPRIVLLDLWNRYRASESRHEAIPDHVFDDAMKLWEAQGLIFIDAELVFLRPAFITEIVKPLVDHRLKDEVFSGQIKRAVVEFLRGAPETDRKALTGQLKIFAKSGAISSPLLLSFLWQHVPALKQEHYRPLLKMLADSGVFFPSESDGVAVVPFRLPKKPSQLAKFWPDSLAAGQVQFELKFDLLSGCPSGLPERFAAETSKFGVTLDSWIDGAVVSDATPRVIYTRRGGAKVLNFGVRCPAQQKEVALEAFRDAMEIFESQRKKLGLVGLIYETKLYCRKCQTGECDWCADTIDFVCTECGHTERFQRYNDQQGATYSVECERQLLTRLIDMDANIREHFEVVKAQLRRNFTTIQGLARNDQKYPMLFIIQPAGKQQWTWLDCLSFPYDVFHHKFRLVFICADCLKPVKYDGQDGLEFSVLKHHHASVVESVHEFCRKHGLIIKCASRLLKLAMKKVLDDLSSDIDALPGVLSDAVKKSRFKRYFDNAKMIGRLLDSGPGAKMQRDNIDVHYETVQAFKAFGDLLETIGFDPNRLPMKPVADAASGQLKWVCSQPCGHPVSTLLHPEGTVSPKTSGPCCVIQ